jgi:hypothetical protein
VMWQQPLPPQITSFTSSCSTCRGEYTLSWRTLYADSCTLNGRSVPVNSDSWPESAPESNCTKNSDCSHACQTTSRNVTYTLSCSNSAGSTSQSLTVTEVWSQCI